MHNAQVQLRCRIALQAPSVEPRDHFGRVLLHAQNIAMHDVQVVCCNSRTLGCCIFPQLHHLLYLLLVSRRQRPPRPLLSLDPSMHHEVSTSGFLKELIGASGQLSAAEGAHLGHPSRPKALDARPVKAVAARKFES